jgi:nucleotide-binding universal stress UspA family protein
MRESKMYEKLLVAVDNSEYSHHAMDCGAALSAELGASLVGMHVYAAQLHCSRFIQLEEWLPEQYKGVEQLEEQREIHGKLIREGLKIISKSYLKVFQEKCDELGLALKKKSVEGRNYFELIEEVRTGGYDAVVLGWAGLGSVGEGFAGSVCMNVARKAEADVLVVKNGRELGGGRILVCLDGSADSFHAMRKALTLGKTFGASVEAVSVYDPEFHRTIFKKLASVLSESEKGRFVFRGQEKLHNDIIDNSLSKLYLSQLEKARQLARVEGMTLDAHLLSGKAYLEILTHIEASEPTLVVVGRHGLHNTGMMDMGSTTENLLRYSPSNLLVSRAHGGSEPAGRNGGS